MCSSGQGMESCLGLLDGAIRYFNHAAPLHRVLSLQPVRHYCSSLAMESVGFEGRLEAAGIHLAHLVVLLSRVYLILSSNSLFQLLNLRPLVVLFSEVVERRRSLLVSKLYETPVALNQWTPHQV